MKGRAFYSASHTGRRRRSRVDFWISTSACDWNAFTSIDPTLLRLLRILMSGSPCAYSSVELKNSQPSGSSVAIEPTRASCTSGICSFTSRYASITPSGSFHGSKRDTWQISGRSTSMPNWSHTNAASSGDSAMFFGDSGSIRRGRVPVHEVRRHVVLEVEDRAVVALDLGRDALDRRRVRRGEVDVAAPD